MGAPLVIIFILVGFFLINQQLLGSAINEPFTAAPGTNLAALAGYKCLSHERFHGGCRPSRPVRAHFRAGIAHEHLAVHLNGLVQGKIYRKAWNFSMKYGGFPVDFPLNQSIDHHVPAIFSHFGLEYGQPWSMAKILGPDDHRHPKCLMSPQPRHAPVMSQEW